MEAVHTYCRLLIRDMMHIITHLLLNMARAIVADQYEQKAQSRTFHLTKVNIRYVHSLCIQLTDILNPIVIYCIRNRNTRGKPDVFAGVHFSHIPL